MKKLFSLNFLVFIAIIFSAIIGGAAVVYTKIGLGQIPPFSFTFLRFAIASLCILPFFLKNLPKPDKNFYKVILFSLILSFNIIVFPFGIMLTTATISQTLYATVPIFVAVFSFFLLSERVPSRKIFGIILGFAGTLVIILLPEINHGNPSAGNLAGNLILIVTVAATSLYNTLSKKFQKQYAPLQLTAIFIFTTTVLLAFLAGFELLKNPALWKHAPIQAFGEAAYVGLFGTVIYYVLTQYIIKHASPLIASLMFYLLPISAFVWAYLLLGEQITSGLIFGALLTFAGVFLILKRKN